MNLSIPQTERPQAPKRMTAQRNWDITFENNDHYLIHDHLSITFENNDH
jgi:hypothetical protein